ncbi:MAG: hypothetical protein ACKER6_01565 [Candidatus Hodgkinia cicadicola]
MKKLLALTPSLPCDLGIKVIADEIVIHNLINDQALPFGVFLKGKCLILSSFTSRSTRSTTLNLIKGLKFNHVRWLVLRGSGFKAWSEEAKLCLRLGFSHCIYVNIPSNIMASVYHNVKIRLVGSCLSRLTLLAQVIRLKRIPDAYKGKGILYRFEQRKTKPGKRK